MRISDWSSDVCSSDLPAHIDALLRPKLAHVFPQLKDVRFDYAWTGDFSLTLSRLPQVGRLAPNIYYSQGCSGHGVTFTHLIGRVLSEAIRGQAERVDAFAKLPHTPFPGGRLLDRKSVVSGKSVSVSVDIGGRRLLTKKTVQKP